ncbi:MAG: hypothetical protein GOV00_02855 [Candidatus Altiarchaeota archaeon]|nr:hypothetical protein [Candidatus Altiarchaeota archaeon]
MKLVIVPHPNYMTSEVVERKEIGHPDSLCDGIAEAMSRELSKAYLKETGRIQHHNVDKVLLVAGQSQTAWGGGRVTEPIRIILAGRATPGVPIKEITTKAALDLLLGVLPDTKAEHFNIECAIGEGASELQGSVDEVVANDTSVGVAFAPFSKAEQLTKDISAFITGKKFTSEWPEVGMDIKVMTNQDNGTLDVTIAMAFIGKYLKDLTNYRKSKAAITELLRDKFAMTGKNNLVINTLDKYENKDQVYLTVTGTSAEQGDDGEVGRGNRVNGLITPARPMSLEAAAGKNPVSHVGKLYNTMAQLIADRIYKETGKPAEVILQSKIGHLVTDPAIVILRTDATGLESIVNDELHRLPEITQGFVEGKFKVF